MAASRSHEPSQYHTSIGLLTLEERNDKGISSVGVDLFIVVISCMFLGLGILYTLMVRELHSPACSHGDT